MSYTGKCLKDFYAILAQMPDGIYFDTNPDLFNRLQFQANTQEEVQTIMAFFPGAIWNKDYDLTRGWWDYRTKWRGYLIEIYAVREAPITCRAIMKKQTVKVKKPFLYREYEEEKEVIVGWDCKDE